MNTNDLELFVRTAQTNSITASAQYLDMTPATASAALKRLEKQLGVQLFIRSTRKLRITAEGERYLAFCQQALEALTQGQASLEKMQGKLGGEIRLSTPSDLGRNIVLPWLDELLNSHPELSIQLNVGDAIADFYHDKVDLALRYGEPEDSSMVAFPITDVDRVVCASPDYLQQYGTPTSPEDLLNHNCLLYRIGERIFDRWEFTQGTSSQSITVKGRHISNDADIVHRWAVSGQGITWKSRLDMVQDLQNGNVVELLADYPSSPLSLWLVCPNRSQVTPAVLLLRDLLREKCIEILTSTSRKK